MKAKKVQSLVAPDRRETTPPPYRGEVVRDESSLLIESFLERPHQFIAEAITGGIVSGKNGLLESSGRIFQGVMRGQFKQQLSKEFTELIDKGKIKKDFGEKLYGFQTLTELFEMIDSGELKEKEKFEALKKLFFVLSSTDSSEKEVIVYRLFKISQQLTSSQLALLRACYALSNDRASKNLILYDAWREMIFESLGHRVPEFVDADQSVLVELKLLTPRMHSDESGVNEQRGRLTASGMKLCKLLQEKL